MHSISYARRQFTPAVIRHPVWLYHRFTLSYRYVEEMLAERGINVRYESVRRWALKFEPQFAGGLARHQPDPIIAGISTKWSTLAAAICICGEPWTARARCWTC
jgi:transposase-like protein